MSKAWIILQVFTAYLAACGLFLKNYGKALLYTKVSVVPLRLVQGVWTTPDDTAGGNTTSGQSFRDLLGHLYL